jgi:hypothetical protein
MRKIGRIKGGAPAVYVGYGYGLSVSSLDNGLIAGEWLGEDETASKMPLPLQSECDGAHAALFKMQSVVLARDACAASRQEILEMYEAAVKERDLARAQATVPKPRTSGTGMCPYCGQPAGSSGCQRSHP